jgi:uncharacterized repeat protein (TIGR01451 family)
MRFLRLSCAALLLALVPVSSYLVSSSQAISPDVVISQVYGGGGNSGAVLTHDFIELYNRGPVDVPVDGWSVQYASSAGVFGGAANTITPLSGTIRAGGYLLVQEAQGAAGTAPLPTPDVTDDTPIAMSGTNGKVALVTTTQGLGCATIAACAAQATFIKDVVGYGTASYVEGSGPAPTLTNTTAALRQRDGAQDTDDNAADFVRGAPNPRNSGGVTPRLTIADVSLPEGDTSDTTATFVVQLSRPAGLGGVAFTIATADGTATLADLDYVALGPVEGFIPPGATSQSFSVTINADLKPEPDETFVVNVTNVVGVVTLVDGQATGTIANDDVETLAIHKIQGTIDRSPRVNEVVATTGIVTGRKSNGFFLQTRDAEVDSDSKTSEGIFVFTSQPPSTVAVGDAVRVSGRVVEFRRTADVRPHTLTEMTAPLSVTVLSSGNALPSAVDAASIPVNAPGRVAQLEPYESMLVGAASLRVVAPTNGFGEFYGVLPGRPRPFREPGIDVSDTLPVNAPPGVARFDGNHERVMVDSDESLSAAGGRRPAVVLSTGATVTPVFGPLDYAFDEYRVSLDSETPVAVTSGMARRPLTGATPEELSIVSLNVLNFFPNGTSEAARAAFAARLEQVANAVVEDLRRPDILGLIEVGDISGLRQLRDRINMLAGTTYEAYLLESDADAGNDQDVGYLVNLARVTVESEPFQIVPPQGNSFLFCDVPEVVFDRPPFVLEARFDGMPVTVILNHLRSLIDVNSTEPVDPVRFPNCTATEGERVRAKRREGAEALADAVAARHDQNLVVMGDMNAFEVNDGYGDIIGTVEGTPADPNTVVAASTDDWSYTLTSLARLVPAADRYSYVHEGSAQVLDHMLVNRAMLDRATSFGFARINADFPEHERLSDHDAVFATFVPVAHLATTTELPEWVVSGSAFSFDVTVTNAGPDRADNVTVSITLPVGASADSANAPDGWTCTAAGPAVTCTANRLDAEKSARIVVHATAACDVANGSTLSVSTTASSADDVNAVDNGSSDTFVVSNPAPVISGVSVDNMVLWPADHRMQDVQVSYTVSDNCGTAKVTLSVTSNEPANGLGDGDTGPDWEVVGPNAVRLRAERSARGSGRVYTITITATDSAGNASTQTVNVTVPHNR